MATLDNYQLLIQKLDQFIRKFYINKLIKGALYSLGLVLGLFLLIAVLEYYFYFSPSGRKGLLFSFTGISLLALGYWVLWPLLQYFRLGSVISHEQAATIIGDHFSNVEDKLLNILQLKKQAEGQQDNGLILAGIDQKSEEIKPVPFRSAINLSQNRKYLPYALPPLLLLLVLLLAAPTIITDSTNRLIRNNEVFERPAPFAFELQQNDLSVIQYEDFPITVKVSGNQLPSEVFIEVDDYQYRMKQEAPDAFSYRFKKVQKDLNFRMFSSGVNSQKYELKVLAKPSITGFEVELDYPSYTGLKDEKLNNTGDLVVPAGSNIKWVFNSAFTDTIALIFSGEDRIAAAERFGDDLFSFKKRVLQGQMYTLFVSNRVMPKADSISYSLSVIPDQYPQIEVETFEDITDNKLLFFIGEASDDYGIRNLNFNYRINKNGAEPGPLQETLLQRPEGKQTEYDYTFDLAELVLEPGDEVIYYFEVFDNDAVNGSKSSRTNFMVFNMPTMEEYEAMAEANDEAIKDKLEEALEESQKIQEDMKRMREKLLQEKELDWQNREELEKLLQRQEELQKQVEEAKEKFDENRSNQEEFEQISPEEQEKQEKLEELFEKLQDEEMQELMEKIQELMQQLDKEQALEMMEQMEQNNETMEMDMERLQELFKQLELQQEMEQTIDKLEELAEEQEALSEETEQVQQEQEKHKENDQQPNQQAQQELQQKQEELQQKQEQIDQEFQEVKEKMEQIEQKNQEMETPQDLDSETREQEMEDIQRDIDDSEMQLQQQQNNKAQQSQKNAAQKMQQMAQNMQQQMEGQQMEQMMEDMAALRQLLENIVGLSFNQEDLIDEFELTEINTPRYVELVQDQFKLQEDFQIVEDSLQALAKRVFQIESFITEKVGSIKDNLSESLEELEERRKVQAADHQQRSMKNLNDLALMLSEVMNNMQQQMSSMMSGQQMCSQPQQGQGQQPQDKISQGQQQLNQEMRERAQEMKRQGAEGMSAEEFAKMAARQAALRQALEEKQRQLREQGQGKSELQELIENMDKVETELVNKRLTNEMIRRQEEILTRLLDHENAEREQEFDEQRKSETARARDRQMPPELEEYIRQRRSEIELYKTVSPSLKPYYKSLVEKYFDSLQQSGGGN